MQLFGQQCRKCPPGNRPYTDPIYEPEKIRTIIGALQERIGRDCYGKPRPAKPRNPNDDQNAITGPHESRLCEACRLGVCSYQKQRHVL